LFYLARNPEENTMLEEIKERLLKLQKGLEEMRRYL